MAIIEASSHIELRRRGVTLRHSAISSKVRSTAAAKRWPRPA
jgi:hypothetical protein